MQLLTKQLHSILEVNNHYSATYHPYYKEKLKITKSVYNFFLFRPPSKQLSLLGIPSDYIFKFATYDPYYKKLLGITKSIYNLSLLRSLFKLILLLSISSNCIIKQTTHYLYYKHIVSNTNCTFVDIIKCFYFLCNLGNFSMASLFASYVITCAT